MKLRTILIGGAAVGLLAWLFGRKRSSAPAQPAPPAAAQQAPRETFAYWSALDAAATREFTQANRDRMVAQTAESKAEAVRRYDAAFARHQEYARRANEAWNREHGVT